MQKSSPFQSHKYAHEKPVIHTGIGRRLPPIPISFQTLSLSRTAPTTANSSPRIKKFTNDSNQAARSYDGDFPINTIVHSNSRKMLFYGARLDDELQSHSSTPHIAAKSIMSMNHPLRSQSFRHRSHASVHVKRQLFDDAVQQIRERRRSTPNISRYSTLHSRHRPFDIARTDVWPKPKASVVEDRFLTLVDSDDYTRVREFNIDEKGTVVSRGDSFRLKSPTCYKRESRKIDPTESNSPHSSSDDSIISANNNEKDENNQPSTSAAFYEIYVLGSTGVGKSTLIGQFMTSDHRNTYATDIEQVDNTVSIIIGDKESELTFYEIDLHNNNSWLDGKADVYLLIYSIDSKSSFKEVMNVVDCIRESTTFARHTPVVMAANKVDLERKRAVSKTDAKNAAMIYGFTHYEISVALNLDVDDLLVGLIAEIKHSLKSDLLDHHADVKSSKEGTDTEEVEESSDFKAAIRRFSKRRRQQMGDTNGKQANKCTHFKSNLVERFRNWRRLLPNLNY